jgi:hypothetical protein
MHSVPYVGHPGYQKTIRVVNIQHYWPSMKKEIFYFIAKCLACQNVKDEHRHPASLRHPFPILEWNWAVVTMDFIPNLPRTRNQHDSIMVVVENLTKSSHFIPIKLSHKYRNGTLKVVQLNECSTQVLVRNVGTLRE